MLSQPASLDTLPVEIIRRIAAYGPCESALALLRVNRTLHRACNDHLVFKNIIDNASGISNGTPLWAYKALSLDSSASSWARYALADSRLAQIPSRKPNVTRPDFVRSGAPQLMASHHPLIDHALFKLIHADLHALQDDQHPSHAQDTQALSFCLAARIMSREFPSTHPHLAPSPLPSRPLPSRATVPVRLPAVRNSLVSVLKHALYEPANALSISIHSPDTVAQKHALANQAVAVFSLDLRVALGDNDIRHTAFPLGTAFITPAAQAPPTTTDIPFLSFMDVPLPFSVDAASAFGTGHLAAMTSAAFLEDGEWIGYYCMSISRGVAGRDRVFFDPPMTGIRFVTSRRAAGDEGGPAALSVVAEDGVDGVGGFRLGGEVDPGTGRVVMRKQYGFNGGITAAWDWCCLMTPFGIVGSWGGSDYGGWIWLWKSNWMNSDLSSI